MTIKEYRKIYPILVKKKVEAENILEKRKLKKIESIIDEINAEIKAVAEEISF